MKKDKLFVLVKNFSGVNTDVDVYVAFEDAKEAFRQYTGFEISMNYTNPERQEYSEKYSETKIFELNLPVFLQLKK